VPNTRAKEIGDTAVAKIAALALAGAPTPVNWKAPTLPAGVEPPQIVVSVRKRSEVEYLTNEHNLHSFDGQVTAVTTGGEFLADADDEPGQWLVAIANEFEKWATWLATVTNFHDVRLLELQQYQRTAAGKTLDYSTLKFRIETKEPKP
jgi:hypothetical protein